MLLLVQVRRRPNVLTQALLDATLACMWVDSLMITSYNGMTEK